MQICVSQRCIKHLIAKFNVGLSTVLSTSTNVLEAAQQTVIDNLSILPSGPKPPNPSELLGSNKNEPSN
jgi:Mrp family chromosome partitioning ATPase